MYYMYFLRFAKNKIGRESEREREGERREKKIKLIF